MECGELFERNRRWAEAARAEDPGFFERLEGVQNPDYLWIGCSDSRVPANEILGMLPGELFVHRNVANVVAHTDFNCLSVLQYAVDVLKVKHVIVCGHYGCGGVRAAIDGQAHGLIDNWLGHVRDVQLRHRERFAAVDDPAARHDLLCELNVREQAANVARTSIVQAARARGDGPRIHAWIYRLRDGLLKDLGFDAADCTPEL
jgi:carbonic anhydrase